MLKFAIVENEESDRMLLAGHLKRYFKEQQSEDEIHLFCSAEELLSVTWNEFDVIFFDIDMDGINGMEAAKKIREQSKDILLVFVTNMVGYAIQGYSVQALDFLVKPVSYARLHAEMERIMEMLAKKQPQFLAVKENDHQYQINVSDILFIETYGRKIRIHTTDQTIETNSTIAACEKALEGQAFYRVHSSYLVNLRYVKAIDGNEILVRNERILLSRQKKKEFILALTKYAGNCL